MKQPRKIAHIYKYETNAACNLYPVEAPTNMKISYADIKRQDNHWRIFIMKYWGKWIFPLKAEAIRVIVFISQYFSKSSFQAISYLAGRDALSGSGMANYLPAYMKIEDYIYFSITINEPITKQKNFTLYLRLILHKLLTWNNVYSGARETVAFFYRLVLSWRNRNNSLQGKYRTLNDNNKNDWAPMKVKQIIHH